MSAGKKGAQASRAKKNEEPASAPTIRSLQINMILTALDADKQEIASEIGADRANVVRMIAGNRPALQLRREFASALCARIERLVVGEAAEAKIVVR